MITEEELRKRIEFLEKYQPEHPIVDLMRISGIIALKSVAEEKDEKDDYACEILFNQILKKL